MRRAPRIVASLACLAIAGLSIKPLADPVPILIWNASNSVPVGWYVVRRTPPRRGEIALIRPPVQLALYASARGYLPREAWLLKPVAALPGTIVCRFGAYVSVPGKPLVRAKKYDRRGRPLPVWKGCQRLAEHEVFVLGTHPDSFDSRYFGLLHDADIAGTAVSLSSFFK